MPIDRVFETLSVYMGSAYVNDFNILGRTYQVTAQADNPFRLTLRDVENLKTRNNQRRHGADRLGRDLPRHHRALTACRATTSIPRPRCRWRWRAASPPARRIAAMEKIAEQACCRSGFGFEWTEIALQEKLAGNTAMLAFGLAVVFVFLLLAALYESWLLPLAVILIVPMCMLAAMIGVNIRGLDRNILVEIGLVVLVGLAAKNAILIVEFAKQAQRPGHEPLRRGGRRRAHPAAADPDDVARLHPGRGAAGVRRSAPAPRCASRSAPRCSPACWA